MKNSLPIASLLAAVVLLVACGGRENPRTEVADLSDFGLPEGLPPPAMDSPGVGASATSTDATPADAFLARVVGLCGQAFAGRVRTDEPRAADDPFAGKTLVMHVRDCSADEIRIPFHVGDDHSRTWVLTRSGAGLRLKHDHSHEDGSADAVTMYGGDSRERGTGQRQAFPVDAESVAMFRREGLAASVTNTWAMEFGPGPVFVYELSRPGGRLFQVEFDLSKPVALPPAPWGAEPPAR